MKTVTVFFLTQPFPFTLLLPIKVGPHLSLGMKVHNVDKDPKSDNNMIFDSEQVKVILHAPCT